MNKLISTSFASRAKQAIRKCSHCRSTSHTVNLCDDTSLKIFDTRLISKKEELREIGVDSENSLFYYKTWMLSIEPGLLKAYAMRYCGANSRISTVDCVHRITEKIFCVQQVAEVAEVEEFIPFIVDDTSYQLITDEEMEYIDADIVERYHAMRGYRREPRTSENRKYNNIATNVNDEKKGEIEETTCLICYDDVSSMSFVKLNCGHDFCGTCIQKLLKKCCPTKLPRCALCRVNMSSFEFGDQKTLDKMKSNL
jgi:hypothetical protein